jgi:hypothetical protein
VNVLPIESGGVLLVQWKEERIKEAIREDSRGSGTRGDGNTPDGARSSE